MPLASPDLDAAFEACRRETAEWAKTFYIGTLLLPPEKRRAIWAIYVWCRRTDELMDSAEAQARPVGVSWFPYISTEPQARLSLRSTSCLASQSTPHLGRQNMSPCRGMNLPG